MVIKNWYKRMMVTRSNNHAIAQVGFTLRGPLALWRFLQHLPAKYTVVEDQKNILPSERRVLGTLPW